jgi:monomeric sarcosine oxidase
MTVPQPQRVVIIGAGIVGLSTAYALLSHGVQRVTVLEQETVDHRRSTSHGISRLLRFEYGSDSFYSEMVAYSFMRWQRLERLSRRMLCTPTGVLLLGAEGDSFPQASLRALRERGLPVERLSKQQCNQRFPQFVARAGDSITYNALGGILHASTCLRTLRELVIDLGGEIHEGCRVRRIAHDSQAHPVRICAGASSEFAAERVVVAAGPWVHRVLADLRLPVRLTRQYLLYFAGLSPASFGLHAFPAFMAHELYGFPIHPSASHAAGSTWLKAASHTFGPPTEIDDGQPIDGRAVERIAQQMYELLPALAQARLAHVDACVYDVTPDEDFIIDSLPHDPRIAFATGLSGHGFKFGPLIGELLSSMICQSPPPVALERFRLARFSPMLQASSVA